MPFYPEPRYTACAREARHAADVLSPRLMRIIEGLAEDWASARQRIEELSSDRRVWQPGSHVRSADKRPWHREIAAYMRVPRTTVIRRLDRLHSWGLIDRQGRSYYMFEKTLTLIGMILNKETQEVTVLDTLPD
jgi:hypothetical protein